MSCWLLSKLGELMRKELVLIFNALCCFIDIFILFGRYIFVHVTVYLLMCKHVYVYLYDCFM